MPNKDTYKALLDQDFSQSSNLELDPRAFDRGIHQKIQERRQKRRTFQGMALVLCIAGVSGLTQLSDPSSLQEHISTVSESPKESPAAAELTLNSDRETVEMAHWEDDPFEDWADDMPAEYDLVAGI